MQFTIRHLLHYSYETPVFLEPHEVHLRPRCDSSQTLEDYQLTVDPAPAGQVETLDQEGNPETILWFNDTQETLRVEGRSRVTTHRTNPFDFIFTDPNAQRLPLDSHAVYSDVLQPYTRIDKAPSSLQEWVQTQLETSGYETLTFLQDLLKWIGTHITQIQRDEGQAWAPEKTLRQKEGACRDTAVLFMEACRSVGLAARYVSGYSCLPGSPTEREMHAWAEIFLPGGGWRGFDASAGIAVNDHYVAVAATKDPQDASPLRGPFRGNDVGSKLTYEVNIEAAST